MLYIDNSPQKEPLLEITYWGINHVTLHTYKNDVYTGEFLYIYGELTSKQYNLYNKITEQQALSAADLFGGN